MDGVLVYTKNKYKVYRLIEQNAKQQLGIVVEKVDKTNRIGKFSLLCAKGKERKQDK